MALSLEAPATNMPAAPKTPLAGLAHLRHGLALIEQFAFEAAVAAFSRAITARPALEPRALAEAYFQRGAVQRMLHRYAEAICDADSAVGLAPEVAHYHMDLGYARYWAKDYAGALADLNRALALDPAEAWAYGYRGRVYVALGDTAAALADYAIAIRLNSAEALFYLWRAQAHAAEGQFAAAEADSTRGLQLTDDDARLWLERGWARWGQQTDLAGALHDLNESLRLRPDPLAYLGRGLVQRALGRDADAERDFTQFIQRHPVGPLAALKQLNQALSQATPAEGALV